MSPQVAAIAVLAAVLIAAVLSDVRSRRIPNTLVLAGLGAACTLHLVAYLGGAVPLAGTPVWSPLAGLFTGGALLLPLYLLRACGAGDVKLMALCGAFVGPATAAHAVVYTLIAGGLLSLVVMAGRGVAAQALANVQFMLTNWLQRVRTGQGVSIDPLAQTAARLPYGIAIAMGTAAALFARGGAVIG